MMSRYEDEEFRLNGCLADRDEDIAYELERQRRIDEQAEAADMRRDQIRDEEITA